MKLIQLSLIAFGGLRLLGSAHAAGMEIKPGQWEFRSQTSMPVQGGIRENVNKQCLKDATVTPQTLMKDMQQGCELLDSKGTANSLSWKVSCSGGGGDMTGEGNVTGSDETLQGGMKMVVSYNGQKMNMAVSWDGKYVGPCP
jgi:hypothetical protein